MWGRRSTFLHVSSISVVLIDPEFAPRDQAAWAFTDGDDASAVAEFLNETLGGGDTVAWVEVVPLARKLNQHVLNYLDCWAEVADEMLLEDD